MHSCKKILLAVSVFALPMLVWISKADAELQPLTTEELDTRTIEHYEYIPPKAKKRKWPKYPADAARDYQEGWVLLNYAVNEKGRVEEVVVVDSSGLKEFEKSARKAVRKWRYEPATRNGEVVYACKNQVRLDFTLEQTRDGVTDEFNRLYSALFEAIDAGDSEAAIDNFQKLNDRKAWNFTEIYYANQASIAYAQFSEDTLLQEYYAGRALFEVGGTKEADYARLLTVLVALEGYALNGAYLEAKRLHKEYFSGDVKMPEDEKSQTLIQQSAQIMTLVNERLSSETIARTAKINKLGVFHHDLVKQHFSIAEIEGNIENVEIRCESKYADLEINDDEVVSIPSSWGKCGLTVLGEGNAKLTIYEHDTLPNA